MSENLPAAEVQPTPLVKRRLYVYVDGYNLFNGLKDHNAKNLYWLNLWLLGKSLEKPGIELKHVRYFTTYSTGKQPWHNAATAWDREQSRLRQYEYIEALRTLPASVFSIFLGEFRKDYRVCPKCTQAYTHLSEKMTDVALATQIILDAVDDLFDVAIIISADTDQVPPIKICKTRWPKKSMIVAFPPKRKSDDLQRTAHAVLHINDTMLRASQFADEIPRVGARSLKRPPEWS